MTVIEDSKEDRFGRYPIIFKGATLKDIHDWLYKHYWGYKFAIIFDETKDEWEPWRETYVYFLDEALEEAAHYAGKKVVNNG